jgi:hypothetical integral membrane protein (TIGR02206 family)
VVPVAANQFVPYGNSHLVALAILAGGIGLLVGSGHRGSGRFEKGFAGVIVAVALPLQLAQFMPSEWEIRNSLPLQVCDWAWPVACFALWTRSRPASTITVLWGLTLTPQAIFYPSLESPFPDPRWWMFWAMHVLIVWAAVYVLGDVGLRPSWFTYRRALEATFTWALVAFSFNLLAGTNYGYLNGKPPRASGLDFLGPWPWYVLSEAGLVIAVWALLVRVWIEKASATDFASMPRASVDEARLIADHFEEESRQFGRRT